MLDPVWYHLFGVAVLRWTPYHHPMLAGFSRVSPNRVYDATILFDRSVLEHYLQLPWADVNVCVTLQCIDNDTESTRA